MNAMGRKWTALVASLLLLQACFYGMSGDDGTAYAAAGGPILIGTSPADNATGVPANADLVMTFDENVVKGTGSASIMIRRVSDNAVFESFETATSSRVRISGNTATIDPSSNFAAGESYYVLADQGAFRNAGGSNFAGIANATAWNFTVAPSGSSGLAVEDRSSSVDVGKAITVKFNQAVYASSGSITIQNQGDGSDIQTIGVLSAAVTGSGTNTIRILPPVPLRGDARYAVRIDSGAFQDGAGRSFSGYNWTLSVNPSPLRVERLAPANNGTGVSSSANLTMTFNTSIAKGAGNITIKRLSDNATVQTIRVVDSRVSVSGSTATIDPPSGLAANTAYYVLVDAGAFVDRATGTGYAGIAGAAEWSFTTSLSADKTPPRVTKLTPSAGGTADGTRAPLVITFNEPVYPGVGNIIIRNTSNDAIFESIAVTSDAVVGGGTNEITITPRNAFATNTSYYVQIGGQVFRDLAGNNYAGISNKTGWNFRVGDAVSSLTIVSISPTTNANNVAVNGTFSATFNMPIQLGNGRITIRSTGGNPIATNASVDSTNNRKLVFTPAEPLEQRKSYHVYIEEGAVTSTAGEPFIGVLNEYFWAFQTIGTDTSPPVLSKAEVVSSTKIRLTYNEPLDEAFPPSPANYYVTVNDTAKMATAVLVSGDTVTLTLQSGVVNGQTIRLYYSKGEQPLKDLSGNEAAGVTNREVTNTPDAIYPRPVGGSISGDTVSLRFNEELAAMDDRAYRQFTVRAGSSSRSVQSGYSSGSTVYLTLSRSVGDASVSVSYSPGSNPLKDRSGNDVRSFSSFYIANTQDTTPPSFVSATVDGSKLTLRFDEGLDATSVPPRSQFSVSVIGGSTRTITNVEIDNDKVILTLSGTVANSQSMLVSYLGGPYLRDLAGNQANTFRDKQVRGVTASGSKIDRATVDGSRIRLTFESPLRTSAVPSASYFVVRVNNVLQVISDVSLSSSTVTLELAEPVKQGDTVRVSYYSSGSTPLETRDGEKIENFVDYTVRNETGITDVDDGDSDENSVTSGTFLGLDAATTSGGETTGGTAADKYTIDGTQLTIAFGRARTAGGSGVRSTVTFKVPDSQRAAIVALPIRALENSSRMAPMSSFTVTYGDYTYEVPLSAIDFQALNKEIIASGSIGELVIEIDASGAGGAELQQALNQAGARVAIPPIRFGAAYVAGANAIELADNGYMVGSLKYAGMLNPGTAAVVAFDPDSGIVSYVPTRTLTSNGMTTVVFQRKLSGIVAVAEGNAAYGDLATHWGRNDIMLLANKFIADGRSAVAFEPTMPITRGEFATYIARGLGLPGDRSSAAGFSDVGATHASAAYIGAASKAGIVAGMPDGTFRPNEFITREQMASMIVRAIRTSSSDVSMTQNESSYLSRFKDQGDIATWARTDVAKAVLAGVINGVTPDTFSPKKNASRAEGVIMIKRMLTHIHFIDE